MSIGYTMMDFFMHVITFLYSKKSHIKIFGKIMMLKVRSSFFWKNDGDENNKL